jgi:hypothetical protein
MAASDLGTTALLDLPLRPLWVSRAGGFRFLPGRFIRLPVYQNRQKPIKS